MFLARFRAEKIFMRTVSKLLFAATAMLAVAGSAFAAERAHILNVRMPDGSIQRLRYTGEVPVHVVVLPRRVVTPVQVQVARRMDMMDMMMADMDRQFA